MNVGELTQHIAKLKADGVINDDTEVCSIGMERAEGCEFDEYERDIENLVTVKNTKTNVVRLLLQLQN
jgi:hypothetical protein